MMSQDMAAFSPEVHTLHRLLGEKVFHKFLVRVRSQGYTSKVQLACHCNLPSACNFLLMTLFTVLWLISPIRAVCSRTCHKYTYHRLFDL